MVNGPVRACDVNVYTGVTESTDVLTLTDRIKCGSCAPGEIPTSAMSVLIGGAELGTGHRDNASALALDLPAR